MRWSSIVLQRLATQSNDKQSEDTEGRVKRRRSHQFGREIVRRFLVLDQRAAVLDVSAEVSVGVVDVAHNRTHYPLVLVHEPYRGIAIVCGRPSLSKRAVLYCCLARRGGAHAPPSYPTSVDIVCGARAASC